MAIRLTEKRNTTPAGEGVRRLWSATAVAYEHITGLSFRALAPEEQAKWLMGLSKAFEMEKTTS